MISSLSKPVIGACVGQIDKPLYGSKSDSLGNPLGEGQLICSNGHVQRDSGGNYIRFSSHNDFVINGTTYLEQFWMDGFLIYRSKDSGGDWDYKYAHLGFTQTLILGVQT